MKAALYARYSTEMQSAASIEDQLRVCERLAERHGFEVAARFSDAAISGGTTQRPGYQDMLTAARARQFDVILAEDTSRLWRNLAEQSPRLAELSDLGLHVVTHDLDTRHESAEIMGAVGGAMASAYRKEIGRRTRRGLEGRARLNKPTGGRSYGYVSAQESVTKDRAIDPEQAMVVRQIFEWYAGGWSPQRIAAELNARKVPSPGSAWARVQRRANGWLCSAIAGDQRRGCGILNNELYIGHVIWNRAKWTRSAADSHKRKQVQNPRSDWIIHEIEALRIIPAALWDRVKARQRIQTERIGARVARGIAAERAKATGRGPRYLFSTLLQCAECGSNFVIVNRTDYGCSSHKHGGSAACSNKLLLKRSIIEAGLLEGIQRELLAPEVLAEFKRRAIKRMSAAHRQPPVDLKRVAELEGQIANLADAVAAGALRSSPALASRLAEAEAELGRFRRQAEPREVAKVERMLPRLADSFRELVADLPNAVQRDVDRARATVRRYTGNVIRVVTEGDRVRFLSEKAAFEATCLRIADGAAAYKTNVVAGVGFEPTTFGL